MHPGRANRKAAARATARTINPAETIARPAGSGVLFRVAIDSFSWEDKGGFTLGEFAIAGRGA
jgi:hypothetical protein